MKVLRFWNRFGYRGRVQTGRFVSFYSSRDDHYLGFFYANKLFIFWFALTFMALLVACTNSSANSAPGVMIVKFKSASPLATMAQELFESGKSFESVTKTPYLDELNRKYKVIKVTKLQQDPRSWQAIKEKFPERSKRIPPGTPGGRLNGSVYRVEFMEQQIDVSIVCDQYAQDPNVEYAQPDYLVNTQTNEENIR